MSITRKLPKVDRNNAQTQRDMLASLNRIGAVRLAAGDREGAISAFEESLAITRKLAEADPSNAETQRYLVLSLERLGDLKFLAGDRAAALAANEEGAAICRKLLGADPGNVLAQLDLSMILYKIGDLKFLAGDRAAALAANEEALAQRGPAVDRRVEWPPPLVGGPRFGGSRPALFEWVNSFIRDHPDFVRDHPKKIEVMIKNARAIAADCEAQRRRGGRPPPELSTPEKRALIVWFLDENLVATRGHTYSDQILLDMIRNKDWSNLVPNSDPILLQLIINFSSPAAGPASWSGGGRLWPEQLFPASMDDMNDADLRKSLSAGRTKRGIKKPAGAKRKYPPS